MNSAGLWKLGEFWLDDFVLEPLVIIRKAKTFAQLFLENPYLLLQVFDDGLPPAVHPPGKTKQQKRQRIHRKTILLSVGKPQLCLGTGDFRPSRNTHNINRFRSLEFSDTTGDARSWLDWSEHNTESDIGLPDYEISEVACRRAGVPTILNPCATSNHFA